jgi:hypothetical protein
MSLWEIFVVIFSIVAAIIVICCAWWFSGYLCLTFGWYAYDQNAQTITWVVLMAVISAGVKK